MQHDDLRGPIKDPKLLKRVALEQFYDALTTGRMVAFTGSYVNKHFGYCDWSTLVKTHLKAIQKKFEDNYYETLSTESQTADYNRVKNLLAEIETRAMYNDHRQLPADIAMDLAEYITDTDRYSDREKYIVIRKGILEAFELTHNQKYISKRPNVYPIIFDKLRIKRAMTLNYDWELEWDRFTTQYEKDGKRDFGKVPDENFVESKHKNRKDIWKSLLAHPSMTTGSYKSTLRRYVPGRGQVTSEILMRKRSEALIEFCMASPDLETRILHLHGRQDRWQNMLLSRRDYRDFYWRNGYSKLPFEYGTRAIFAGNSIFFIGIGLSEADVMRSLEQFMSDNPSRIKSPQFILWNSEYVNTENGKYEIDTLKNNLKRIDWYRRFGIHIIFDAELAELLSPKELWTIFHGTKKKAYSPKKGAKSYGELIDEETERVVEKIHSGSSKASNSNAVNDPVMGVEFAPPDPANTPEEKDKTRKEIKSALRLSKPLEILDRFIRNRWVYSPWEKSHFCNMQEKYDDYRDLKQKYLAGEPTPDSFSLNLFQIWQPRDFFRGSDKDKIRFLNSTHYDDVNEGKKFERELTNQQPLMLLTQPPGSGKGAFAHDLAKFISSQMGRFTLVINAAFINETDSIFGAFTGSMMEKTAQDRDVSRMEAFEYFLGFHTGTSIKDYKLEPPVNSAFTVVINGMERFVGQDGHPLSIELDHVMRKCIRYFDSRANEKGESKHLPFQLILTGTDRVERYVSTLTDNYTKIRRDKRHDANDKSPKQGYQFITYTNKVPKAVNFQYVNDSTNLCYFDYVRKRVRKKYESENDIGLVTISPNLTQTQNRKVFFRQILGDELLSRKPGKNTHGYSQARLAVRGNSRLPIEVLKVLAFIGQPANLNTIMSITEVRNACGSNSKQSYKKIDKEKRYKKVDKEIEDCVNAMVEIGLIIKMTSFVSDNPVSSRYGLHKSLLAEIRDRYGMPLSDSKLACSFNLSMFTSQSTDGFVPEIQWHDELGRLANNLIDAYKWHPLRVKNRKKRHKKTWLKNRQKEKGFEHYSEEEFPLERLEFSDKDIETVLGQLKKHGYVDYSKHDLNGMLLPESPARLRSALSLIRNYYSTAALLMHTKEEVDPWQKKAPLTEHAIRLRRIINTARDMAIVRAYAKNEASDLRAKIDEKRLKKIMGSEALFPDDLVWLHNELGVVSLSQGKLYAAGKAFTEAVSINEKYVDFDEKLSNWRRISLNMVQLYIDRGNIEDAQELLRNIESVIEDHARRFGSFNLADRETTYDARNITQSAREDIIHRYARGNNGAVYNRCDRDYPTDIILAVGLCLGYRGLCKSLQGAYEAADDNFRDALAIFKAFREKRAYSWFQKHRASVLAELGEDDLSLKALRKSVAAAGTTRQTDLDHHARISLVLYSHSPEVLRLELQEPGPIPQLMRTLNYAKINDMFRLQSEVLQVLAWKHYSNGDYDSAIKYASNGVAVCSKYGHGLRKVSMRIIIARILLKQGNQTSAVNLLDSASRIATKIRFDKAVEHVENIRVSINKER